MRTLMILWMCMPATLALAGPAVPDAALDLVSDDVRSTWDAEELTVSTLDADIEAAEWALANATLEAADARASALDAEEAVDSTRSVVPGTKDSAQLDVDVAKSLVDQAKIARRLQDLGIKRAREDLKHAHTNGTKSRILVAKSGLATAKLDRKRAAVAVRDAKRERATAREERRTSNDDAAESVDVAERAASAAEGVATLGGTREVAARAELALLRAQREVARSTLSLTQARAAVAAGATLDVGTFVDALALAQEDEALARASLVRAEPPTAE